jgi:hypothetical protein
MGSMPSKLRFPKIQLAYEGVDRPYWTVFRDIFVQALREQMAVVDAHAAHRADQAGVVLLRPAELYERVKTLAQQPSQRVEAIRSCAILGDPRPSRSGRAP